MKHPEQDFNGDTLIVELDAEEVEVLELLLERLDILLQIEEALGVVAMQSLSILGNDLPTVTGDGRVLIAKMIEPWMPGAGPVEFVND